MELISQKMRKLAPELDPLRLGTGWTKEDLGKCQIIVESTYGDSHPGSVHLNQLVDAVISGKQEVMGPDISAPISVTERVRERMASISALPAGK